MKTEKEILHYHLTKDPMGINLTQEDRIIHAMQEAVAQSAEQEKGVAIKFAEWITKNQYEYCGRTFNDDSNIYRKLIEGYTEYNIFSTSELSTLFTNKKQ